MLEFLEALAEGKQLPVEPTSHGFSAADKAASAINSTYDFAFDYDVKAKLGQFGVNFREALRAGRIHKVKPSTAFDPMEVFSVWLKAPVNLKLSDKQLCLKNITLGRIVFPHHAMDLYSPARLVAVGSRFQLAVGGNVKG